MLDYSKLTPKAFLRMLEQPSERKELELVLKIMKNNEQLEPILSKCLSANSQTLTREDKRVLRAFFEYLDFASDRFAREIHERSK